MQIGFFPYVQQMDIPRLGVESELQLPGTATATATWDPSHICNLYHSSWQHWILNQLSRARVQTRIFMGTSWVCYHWATTGTPCEFLIHSGFKLFLRYVIFSYFLWVCDLSFHPSNIFWRTKAFKFWFCFKGWFRKFFILLILLLVSDLKKSLANPRSQVFLSCFLLEVL